MAGSLNITQLMDWLEGRLPEDEAQGVAAAIQADESHKAAVTWLRTFLDFSRSTVLVEPPAELHRELIAYFRAFARGNRQTGWLQRLVAALSSDSWQRPSLVGVRHTGLAAAPRQLVYTAPTVDIVLNTQVGASGDTLDLIGQVFPTDGTNPASFTVQLIHHEREAALTYTNKIGKFTCAGLADGIYTIVIHGDVVEITIPDVVLSS